MGATSSMLVRQPLEMLDAEGSTSSDCYLNIRLYQLKKAVYTHSHRRPSASTRSLPFLEGTGVPEHTDKTYPSLEP